MRFWIWTLALLATGLTATPWAAPAPSAGHADNIVAVVNDQVITRTQLQERTRLNLRQLGLASASDAQAQAVMRRTLSGMIDEELQRQFAARARITLSDKDVQRGREAVINTMGGPVAWKKLTQGLERTADEKMRAEMLWDKIAAQAVRPHVQVGLAEVDKLLEELAKSRHVVERQISMIMLSVGDGREGEKAQLEKITDLKAQLDKGANFGALARAYSEDKTAAKGGDMGWFGTGELNPQLESALDKMQPGQVSEPIRTPVGWHLIRLENARTTKPIDTKPVEQLDVYLLAANIPEGEAAQDKLEGLNRALKDIRKRLGTKADVFTYFDKKGYADVFPESQDLGWVTPADLQQPLQDALKGVKVGEWSKPMTIGKKTGIVFVANNRTVMPAGLDAYRNRVMENLFSNRLELATRRFMYEMRQRAFLDIRL